MQDNQEKCKELAIRIYNLDEEVYKCVGSSLGRTFTGQKETTLRHLAALMYTKPDGHLLRSELALISNMARTIRDKSERRRLMIEYDSILKEIESLPDTFGQTDIVDKERISLNNLIVRRQNEISENDHLIICISRTQGSGGNDIGFELADQLQINYYDAEIFDQVMKRLQADKNAVSDTGNFEGLFLKETVFCGLNAKDNIIQNTEAFYQFEMLMYHSNAQVICIVWIFDFNFLSIFVDLALFRLIQTKQNAHQSGFTCSIFAKQSVDLTFF